jgi:signal transduction histidine kinase/CheY-like chemotaxis protein
MMTEPLRLQESLQRALSEQVATYSTAPQVEPAQRQPVPDIVVDSERPAQDVTATPASRPLFAVAAALGATAASVAFNAPAMLLASVAGIAVFAAMPLLRRSLNISVAANPARAKPETKRFQEHDSDREWELGEFSNQLAGLFDALGDMVVICSLNGQIVYANETFRTATGFDNPVGLTLAMAGIEPVDCNGQGTLELLLGEGPEQTIWSWHETTARDPVSGTLTRQCIGRNITEARRTEAELVEAREKAEAANHAKTRFLATVSHEIRTPLNGILGMTHLLGQTQTTPEQESYIKTARESGLSLLSLIEDLLDVTSIEAGRLNLRSEEGDLEELVHGVCELMASRAMKRASRSPRISRPTRHKKITSDIGRLRQVLFNLIGNAIKFTDTGGVLVEVSLENDALTFTVTDTGPGLREEDKAKIFDEFERADNGPTRKHGGAGLGLSISARIVDALGGQIGVASSPGKGSAFHFTVPLEQLADAGQVVSHRGPLSDRAVLVIAPRGPVSAALLWSIRDLGGFAEAADDADSMIAALTRLNRSGAMLSDIVVDRRLAEEADGLLAVAPTVFPEDVARTLVIAPEDSRDLDGHGAHGADAWLVRPVRRTSLINVLTRRDDRDDRNRLASKPRPPVLERESDNPTLDILLAEDDPVNALMVRTILARQGHRVTVVENGRRLIDEAMNRPGGALGYDLAITDLSMPELDGRSAIVRIRDQEEINQLSRLPIIVLSADGQASTRDELLAAGADGHAENRSIRSG